MVIKPILATILVQGAAFAAPCSLVPFPELSVPRWCLDGRQLAFNSVHEGSRQIYVIDVRNIVFSR